MNWARPRPARHPSARKPRPRRTLAVAPLEDRCVPAGNLWTQRGGDAGHTSYVDVAVNPAQIAPAWTHPIDFALGWDQGAVAIDADHVYRTSLEGNSTFHVSAFNLADGTQAWDRVILGYAGEGVGEPSVGGGIVFVNRAGHSGISGGTDFELPRIYGLDAATGATVREQRYGAQWESNERPAILGTQLVAYDGYYGGITSYSTAPSGTLSMPVQWHHNGWQLYDPMAAFDDQYVYAYDTVMFNQATGAIVGSIAPPAGYTYIAEPIVSASGKVLFEVAQGTWAVTNGVSAYDGDTHQPLWTAVVPADVYGKAVGNGVVAVTTASRQLVLLDEATGAPLRTWTAPNPLSGEIVLTRTHAFVESYTTGVSKVHAIDLATGQEAWSFENRPGDGSNGFMEMALAGDKLVLSSYKAVRAFALAGVGQPPDAVDDAATTPEDAPVTVPVLANDTDPDGDALAVTAVGTPTQGTAKINADGTVTYTPAANYNGTDSFTYTISDGHGGTDTATVRLTVTPVNDPPVAAGWQFGTNEDTPLTDALRASDPEGDPLTYAIVSGPGHGAVQLDAATGAFTYIPAADWNGTDSFTFKVNDGALDSAAARVFVTVRPVNDAPVAADDAYPTDEDTTLTVPAAGVLINDTDIEGNALTAVLVAGPGHGTLTLNADGSFTYTPAANYSGPDSFTYKANDGAADSNVATVAIRLNAVNDAPVAADDAAALDEDTPLTVAAPGVLANDTDVDGNPLTATLVTGPAHGTLTLNADGSYTYTPAANYNGPDSFIYRANDGAANSNVASVTLAVRPVNDAPTATADAYSTREDTPLTVSAPGLLANDTDPEGDVLTAVLVSGPAHGTLTLNANGSFTYTPAANYNGPDGFTYKANDGSADSNTASVSLNVTAVPDVAGVTVNQGAAQRSRVTQIAVTFDSAVNLIAGAFSLTRASDGLRVGVINVATTTDASGRTVATLTFAGTGTQRGSLADGRWTLRVDPTKVQAGGVAMAGAYTYGLHRLFGDADGDGDVDAADEAKFNAAYGTRSNQPGYVSYFDFDQDADRNGIRDIDSKDRTQFRKRLGTFI